MIEKMILEIKKYLPLKILEIEADGTSLHMCGSNWGFYTLSVWRICEKNKVILGCFDEGIEKTNFLKNLEIINLDFQTGSLKIDPVFILSNDQRIEIFSTDMYEPWTFSVKEVGSFIATPGEPEIFDTDQSS